MFAVSAVIGILITLSIPAAVVYGIVMLVRRDGASKSDIGSSADEPVPGGPERIVTYVLSFAGCMAVLFALSTLLALAFVPVIPHASALLGADDIRVKVSYCLAALIVGAPLWLGLWRHAQRRVARNPAERETAARRVYLAALAGIGAIVALSGGYQALNAMLLMRGNGVSASGGQDLVTGGSLIAVYGAACVAYLRLGWRERAPGADDWAHDLATYAVMGTSLGFLLAGLGDILYQLMDEAQGAGSLLLSPGGWSAWSGPIASCAIGGVAWWALQIYDARRGRARTLRVVYLYGVLMFVVPLSVYNAASLSYELLRRAFGYQAYPQNRDFLAHVLPWLVVGGAFWAYHWLQIRAQAALSAVAVADGTTGAGTALNSRRLGRAVCTAAGTVMTGIGAGIMIWTGIDAALGTNAALSGGAWWRDQVSLSITLLIVGGALWVPAWTLMQRAVMRDPAGELDTTLRRWLLSALTLGSALVALGFGIAFLYQILRTILGQTDAGTLSSILHFGSTAIVAVAIAAYYGTILRASMNRGTDSPARTPIRVSVLLAPDSDATLAGLMAGGNFQVEVIGAIADDDPASGSDLQTLRDRLAVLGTSGQADRALLVLGPNAGHLYPYGRGVVAGSAARAPARDTQPCPALPAT